MSKWREQIYYKGDHLIVGDAVLGPQDLPKWKDGEDLLLRDTRSLPVT